MKWWLSRRVDEHFIFLSLSLLKKKSKKYFSLKYKYCLLSFCAQILYFVYIYILQLTIETNSPPRNLPFLLLMRSFPRSPPMRSTMAQSLTTLGDGTDWTSDESVTLTKDASDQKVYDEGFSDERVSDELAFHQRCDWLLHHIFNWITLFIYSILEFQ